MNLECNLTKEEFQEQLQKEEELMDAFFSRPPIEVQRGGKREMISYIAETAVALYELNNPNELNEKEQ